MKWLNKEVKQLLDSITTMLVTREKMSKSLMLMESSTSTDSFTHMKELYFKLIV